MRLLLSTRRGFYRLCVCLLVLPALSGCALQTLREENAQLQQEVADLQAEIAALREADPETTTLTPVRSFTVGLAAAEVSFDERAFVDDALPADVFHYLVRATNPCGEGLGAASSGAERPARACP